MALISRYGRRRVFKNNAEQFRLILKERGRDFIRQYTSGQLTYPTMEQISTLHIENHLWGMGDRYDKLAQLHYGDPELWWVIAWFNKKPTDFLVRPGDNVLIPLPLEFILDYLGG